VPECVSLIYAKTKTKTKKPSAVGVSPPYPIWGACDDLPDLLVGWRWGKSPFPLLSAVAVLGKNIWGKGAGPSSFGRQQRLSEITIEIGGWAKFGEASAPRP